MTPIERALDTASRPATGSAPAAGETRATDSAHTPPPYALLAELTHRCPLHCLYCSNPLELVAREAELSTATWVRVLREAADLGVAQIHLSGGEPLVRPDLEEIAEAAASFDLYTQLTTSGVGLDVARARRLARAGVRCVQLSVQAEAAAAGDRIAGYRAHLLKERAAAAVREAGLSLTVNVVLHRLNLDSTGELIELAAAWGADRIELANAQYYNWALLNRAALLPPPSQFREARARVDALRETIGDGMQIVWVDADYISGRVKPCMGGWGRVSMTIAPDGRALPCPAADSIESLEFDSVARRSLGWLWNESPAFRAFRGTAWMPEPCRSCDRREIDFGGCRCQAFALTGDAGLTDPVCELSPNHRIVVDAVAAAAGPASGRPNAAPIHRRVGRFAARGDATAGAARAAEPYSGRGPIEPSSRQGSNGETQR